MKFNPNPPAIVKQADAIKERQSRIKAMYVDDVRTTLERARDRGEEIYKFKNDCQLQGREWTKELGDIPLSTAMRDLRIFVNWTLIEEENSTRRVMPLSQVLKFLKEKLKEDVSESADTAQQTPAPPPSNQTSMFDGSQKRELVCEPCKRQKRVGGVIPATCKACASMIAGRDKPSAPPVECAPNAPLMRPQTATNAPLPAPNPPPVASAPPVRPAPLAAPPADTTPMECCPKCHGKGTIAVKPKREPKAPRPRDVLFDAIAEACGADPHVSGSHIAKLKNLLAGADPPYTPEEIKAWAEQVMSQSWWKGGKPGLGYLEKTIGQIRQKVQSGKTQRPGLEYDPALDPYA